MVTRRVESWAFQVVLVVKNPPADAGDARRHEFNPWVEEIRRRRAWQPTPVFSPGKSHGQRSLTGDSPGPQRGMAEHTHATTQQPTPVILTSSLAYFGVSYLLILVPKKSL